MTLNQIASEFVGSIRALTREVALLREQLASQAQHAQPLPQAPPPQPAPPPPQPAPPQAPRKLLRPKHLRKASPLPQPSNSPAASPERCSETLELFPLKETLITQVGYHDDDFRERIRQLISQGLGYYQIAGKLNGEGYKTERGMRFYHGSVKRLCHSMGLLSEKARRQAHEAG